VFISGSFIVVYVNVAVRITAVTRSVATIEGSRRMTRHDRVQALLTIGTVAVRGGHSSATKIIRCRGTGGIRIIITI
jgi:hypothetical protein